MNAYPAVAEVVEALGGEGLLHATVRTMADLSRLVAAGLPFPSLRRVSARYPVAERARVESIVGSRTTMQRREQSGILSPDESERLERVARVTALAEYVLESRKEAQQFLIAPHALLDGQAPVELAATDLGARRVEDVLWRLEYTLPV